VGAADTEVQSTPVTAMPMNLYTPTFLYASLVYGLIPNARSW